MNNTMPPTMPGTTPAATPAPPLGLKGMINKKLFGKKLKPKAKTTLPDKKAAALKTS